MVRETPFTYSFSINHNQTKTITFSLGSCSAMLSLTIHIEDDGLGPILVNAKVTSGSLVYQLGQPTIIYDSEGINAKRFTWQGNIPTSRMIINELIIQCSNYCGDNINSVRFTGVKRR